MFYSHTFLARKGPMGTVWCAAHLQKTLKKSDYTRTNILTTVEYIMCPEVPIALRMSGHLLLGVVRIYSKQVEYFFQECTYLDLRIRKAFSAANVNLPEGATQATYNSITLPETFQLDALESYDDLYQERFVDTHLKCQEEITLEDQIPVGRDQYVAVSIDEDDERDLSNDDNVSGLNPTPMERDSDPTAEDNTFADFRNSPQNTQKGLNQRDSGDDDVHEENPEPEIFRDAPHGIDPAPLDDVCEPDLFLAEEVVKYNQNISPVVEPPGGFSVPSQHHEHTSASSGDVIGNSDPHLSFGNGSPGLEIRPSPPPPEQPRPRQRKRKLLIDDSLVLPNQTIKAGLSDTSHLKRVRKEVPHSSLDIWRSSKRLKKDAIFFEPLITGQCSDLSKMHERGFIFATAHPSSTEEPHKEPNVAQSSSSLGRDDMEIEHLRDNVGPSNFDFLNGLRFGEPVFLCNTVISSPVTTPMPSPNRQEVFGTPVATSLGSPQADQVARTIDSGVLPTPDHTQSTGNLHTEMEDVHYEATNLSDIHEFANSAGDLSFLDQDDSTPSGSQGTPEVGLSGKQMGTSEFGALSTRSRAVAQYLKGQSSATPVREPGELSLNGVLEGKSRKICARMFFETLVLKNCGLIDVNQEEPYGDIILKATPKLMKEQL